jgi:antitoxin (DNA-binding transcriptional repressor) of toxin-antitoxin stability system
LLLWCKCRKIHKIRIFVRFWDIDMNTIQHIRKTELTRHTRQVIDDVRRGQTAIVETHGQPEVAILDIVDYRIMRAVIHHHTHRPPADLDVDQLGEVLREQIDSQARYNTIFSHYLAGVISLEQVAEFLELSAFDLKVRCQRLDVAKPAKPEVQDVDTAATEESLHPHNRRALTLLQAWQRESDDRDEAWWTSFEEDLSRHRLTLRDAG